MRCKNCKEKFKPKYFLQKYCMMKDDCILAHSNEVKNIKPIRKVSIKKEAETKLYIGKRIIFLGENPTCQASLRGCTHTSTDVHHKAGRIGENYLNVSTWLAVCRNCHTYIELNPKKAKELGFSISRLK